MRSETSRVTSVRRTMSSRVSLAVIALAALLTASFVGVLGLTSDEVLATAERLPIYVLVMGIVFVAGMLRLDSPERDGVRVLVAVSCLSVIAFVVSVLATEGVYYALLRPDEVIHSWLVLYLGAGGFIFSGVIVWTLHHWREFASAAPGYSTWGPR